MKERKCTNERLDCPKAITSTGIIGVCCVAQEWCPSQLPQDLYPVVPKETSEQAMEERIAFLERQVKVLKDNSHSHRESLPWRSNENLPNM